LHATIIAMTTRHGLIFLILILAASLIAAAIIFVGGITNFAETSDETSDAQLRNRRYAAKPEVIREFLSENIPGISTYGRRWRLISTTATDANLLTVIKAEVPVVIFTDDLELRLQAQAETTIVSIRSASRIGQGDWGENRRHILQVLELLDREFAQNGNR